MKTARHLLVLASLVAASCRDGGPTSPTSPPHIGGIWTGTVSVHSGGTCPVTVEIQQDGTATEVTGRIVSDCFAAQFYARLSAGPSWQLSGSAHFSTLDDDCSYQASLSGKVEGSPPSRMTMSTADFRCATHSPTAGGSLELFRT